MTYLLDTSAVLAHVRGEPGAERVQRLFVEKDVSLLLCSVSLAELARRLRALGATPDEAWDRAVAYGQLVDEVVSVDEEVARESDRLSRRATARLPLVDALIAATAHTRKAVLVHRDTHIRLIPADLLAQLDLAAAPVP
ncbi:MAG: PIN domain-containing protein [Verrucomicrobiales bacterium]|nr:PIN domain-containing protein [Verrucomicrobiales bacterium]